MREWLEVLVTESGLVVAQQSIQRPPLMVAQMTEEWLNYYRKIAQSNTVPGGRIFFSTITIFYKLLRRDGLSSLRYKIEVPAGIIFALQFSG